MPALSKRQVHSRAAAGERWLNEEFLFENDESDPEFRQRII